MAVAVKVIDSLLHWGIATAIAAGIAYAMLWAHSRNEKPCKERACYQMVDSRLSAIEAEMSVRTEDRYRGADAKRDMALMMKQINEVRTEMDKRMERLER